MSKTLSPRKIIPQPHPGPRPATKKSDATIKLFLADDHRGVRDSLAEFLDDHESFTVVGLAEKGTEVLAAAAKLRPDIVLMDIDMPGISGLAVTEKLNEKFPEIKVVMFSGYTDDSYKMRAFAAGASGYIEKSEDLEKTVQTLLQVHAQDEALLQSLRRRLRDLSAQGQEPAHDLTPAEINVLETLKDGKEMKKAAEVLHLSVKTLESHLSRINSKLGAANLREAIFNAVRLNIISMK